MTLVSSYLAIVTLNLKWLISSIKKYRTAGWPKKKKKHQKTQPIFYAAYKRLTSALRIYIGSNWRDGNISHANENQRRMR